MLRNRHLCINRICRLVDQAILATSLSFVVFLRPHELINGELLGSYFLHTTQANLHDIIGTILLLCSWVFIFNYSIRYSEGRFISLKRQMASFLRASTISSFLLVLVSVVFTFERLTLYNIVIFWLMANTFGLISRIFFRAVNIHARKTGKTVRNLLMINVSEKSLAFAEKLENDLEMGYRVIGFLSNEETTSVSKWPIKGKLSNLQDVLKNEQVDEVMISASLSQSFQDIMDVIKNANDLGIVARILPGAKEGRLFRKLRVESFQGESIVALFSDQLLVQVVLKRMLDIGISISVLVVASPIFAIVAALIKLSDKGPVFFAQDRVGINQRKFKMLKFRSMVVNAEEIKDQLSHLNEQEGPVFKITDDPRITKIGRFIRKTSIDELPQLLNVLSGEMSLVGPRPPLAKEVEGYEWKYRKRLSIKPGITCLWQVKGRNGVTFKKWMQLDRYYVDNWSVMLDIKILLMTIPAVLFGKGAS